MGPFAYRSWVEISLKQIVENFRAVRDVVGADVEVMPVVKADAYRHGAVEVSKALAAAGARWLAVSNVEEGAILRDRGITTRILVMADFLPAERTGLLDYNLTPVIHSLPDIAEWDRVAAARGVTADYHLKIDGGMGRLGTRGAAPEILQAIGAATHVRLEGLMTHFASAANYSSTQTEEQVAAFQTLASELARAGVHPPILHLASSTPIAYGRREAWQRMVRPGHAVYGYISQVAKGTAPPRMLNVRPALAWKTAVLAVKDLPAGALVGYGGMYRTTQPTRIAVLAAGYADGIPHRLSNKGRVIARGHLAPIIGAVSMDLTTIDITHCPPLAPGDAVTLLGTEGGVSIDAQQIARVAGTISYSVLCGIHARVKRVYVD
ncbi:MAG TPA: alanine racemase [Bryobacteraceae bacterium]|nr:alanine racemase [Bryobacteraceae bacterium]